MITAIEECKYTEEEKATFRKECAELKGQIKELAETQREDKSLLRTPHHKLPQKDGSGWSSTDRAGDLMYGCWCRANKITSLHIQYNKLRGKPTDMHEYKN